MSLSRDQIFMSRALQIARFAEGRTAPNPMVGALVVHDNLIVGEGFHHKAGLPHAEPNAIREAESSLLRKYNGDNKKVAQTLHESEVFVTLEPCSHWGKTPPCAKLLCDKHPRRVVIGSLDCNPVVAGNGVRMLQDAGIEVQVGILENECRSLNRRFFTFHQQKRPYIILKWAETRDGFLDIMRQTKGNGPLKISNAVTKTLNHQMRCSEDAIMVATNTAILDDPHLTVSKWSGKNPVRVLLDRKLRVPKQSRIFDNKARTIVFTEMSSTQGYAENVHFIQVPFDDNLVNNVIKGLYDSAIQSVIIEGGARWLQSVIDNGIWDEVHIERGNEIIHQGVSSPTIDALPTECTTILNNNVILFSR